MKFQSYWLILFFLILWWMLIMQEQFIELVHYGKIIETLKPGSHMPLMHLRHGRRYCLGYCSNMRTEVAGNIAHPSLDTPRKASLYVFDQKS